MTTTRPWLATLVERAVSEYLTATHPRNLSTSSIQYHEGLSNTLITPDPGLLRTVNLLDFQRKATEVKGVIGDTEHSARVTFTKEALNKPAITTEGTSFTHLQIGSVFRILACQVRVSDCFDPPKVDIRVSSCVIVSLDGGSTDTTHLKRVEDEPSVLMNLVEYNLRHSGSMADSDSENQEPFASQEAYQTQIPYLSLKASSPRQPSLPTPDFSDQASLQLSDKHTAKKAGARPLNNVSINAPGRDSRDACVKQRHSVSVGKAFAEPVLSDPNLITQTSAQRDRLSGSANSPQESRDEAKTGVHVPQPLQNGMLQSQNLPASILAKDVLGLLCDSPAACELLLQEPNADTKQHMVVRDVCFQNETAAADLGTFMKELSSKPHWGSDESTEDLIKKETHRQERQRLLSSTKDLSRWKRKSTTQWLSRFAKPAKETKLAKEQQKVIDDDASWDPPLIGQPSIKGQIPLELLDRFCRRADRIAMASHRSKEIGESGVDEEASEDSKVPISDEAIGSTGNLLIAQMSPPTSTQTSWPPSPRVSPERSIQQHPRLPPDSSPLKALANVPEDRATPKPPTNNDDSFASSFAEDQDIPSSPLPQTIDSDGESSFMPHDDEEETPAQSQKEAPEKFVAQIAAENLAMSNAEHLPEATPRRSGGPSSVRQPTSSLGDGSPENLAVSEKDYEGIVNGHAQNNDDTSAPQKVTSSLELAESIQVSRTPAVQRRNLETDVSPNGRLNGMTTRQSDLALSSTTLSLALPHSSSCVPGTLLPNLPAKDVAAPSLLPCKSMPPPNFEQLKSDDKPVADIAMEGTDKDRPGALKRKRRQADDKNEEYPKRRKVEDEPYKPVFRGKDADYMDLELRERQERHDWMEEQMKHSTGGREDRTCTAIAVGDDQSVESRERPPSPRSSVLSLARQYVSTPLTRSSDYQLPAVNKRHASDAASNDISTCQTPQDVFKSFREHYSEYTGGRKQFDKACQLISRLGQPPAFAWDDFVFRYNEDYLDYQAAENEAGRLPLPYERYYNTSVEKMVCQGEIITRSYISSLSDRSSVKESTPCVTVHPTKAPGLFERQSIMQRDSISNSELREPHLPPPPPRSKAENPTPKVGSQYENPLPRRIDHSHDSSVMMWAEQVAQVDPPDKIWRVKAAGAESPELGTPPMPREIAEVPLLDLEAPTSSPIPLPAVRRVRRASPPPVARHARRSLPWQSPRAIPRAVPRTLDSAAVRATGEEKGKGKASRRYVDFPVRRPGDVVDLTGPVVFQKPRPNAELPMMKLEREFAALDGRRGFLNAPAREVDIFSWRK